MKLILIWLNLVKKKRIAKGFTLQQMVKALGLRDKSSYHKRENGDLNFQVGEIPILQDVLKISGKKIFVEVLRKFQQAKTVKEVSE